VCSCITTCPRPCPPIPSLSASDEIYALSVYKPAAFTSGLDVAQRLVAAAGGGPAAGAGLFPQSQVDSYVHLVYGLSKDWCASGLRVGLLYSRSAPLQAALNSLAPFASLSNHTQHALTEALGDDAWADAFLAANAAALGRQYDALASALGGAGIPFAPGVAGMFVWVDLRRWLRGEGWPAEAALWETLCDDCKVILTPGRACHAAEPGFFRLCFAWVPQEALEAAVARVAARLAEM
jgi:1-aminocyclopropane-1-carboxylate synthase